MGVGEAETKVRGPSAFVREAASVRWSRMAKTDDMPILEEAVLIPGAYRAGVVRLRGKPKLEPEDTEPERRAKRRRR